MQCSAVQRRPRKGRSAATVQPPQSVSSAQRPPKEPGRVHLYLGHKNKVHFGVMHVVVVVGLSLACCGRAELNNEHQQRDRECVSLSLFGLLLAETEEEKSRQNGPHARQSTPHENGRQFDTCRRFPSPFRGPTPSFWPPFRSFPASKETPHRKAQMERRQTSGLVAPSEPPSQRAREPKRPLRAPLERPGDAYSGLWGPLISGPLWSAQ